MASNNNDGYGFPIGITGAVALGVVWTIVAGTMWQWVPICASIGATVVVMRHMEDALRKDKPKPKAKAKPKAKGGAVAD